MTATESVQPLPPKAGNHFEWDELACHDAIGTPYPLDLRATNGIRLGRELDRIRDRCGCELFVSSGYRTWAYHTSIYAAMRPKQTAPAGSLHLQGLAADLACPADMPWLTFVAHIKAAAAEPGSTIRYLKFYRPPRGNFAHVDCRHSVHLLMEYAT